MNALTSWGIIFLLALLDQASKKLVLHSIPFQESVPVIPGFFNLTHLYNTGAAFGMLHDSNIFFIIVSAIAFIALVVMKRHFGGVMMHWGWVLLLSGIIGNVTDRVLHGHVIDFLDFQFGNYHWPSFNLADSSICIAAGIFLLSSFRGQATKQQ